MNKFVVSVADVALFDPTTNALIGVAKAATDASITSEIDTNEIRAGKGNEKVFEYKHSRTVDLAMTSAAFEYKLMALQTGNAITTGTEDLYQFGECVTLDQSGVGTIQKSAVNNVVFIMHNGTVYSVTPSGPENKTITKLDLAGETVEVYYQSAITNVEKISITGSGIPKIVKAVMTADIADNTGFIGTLQIVIPRLQLNGTIEIGMTPDGVASTNIGGTALAAQDACGDSVYANLFVHITGSNIVYTALAAIPSVIALGVGDTQILTVYGMRGSQYAPVLLANSSLEFTSSDAGTASVTTAGVITGVAAGTAYITVELDGADSDVVEVTVT